MFASRRAVTRVQAAVVIVVLVVAIAGLVYSYSYLSSPRQATTQPTSKMVDTLSIDEATFPSFGWVNQLYAILGAPWPNWLYYTVYQPLVAVNITAEYQQGVVRYLPGLADSWSISSDSKVYTFNIKQNVKFSNGDPLNAYQVWGEMYGFYYLSGNGTAWLESQPLIDMSPAQFGPATIDLMTKSGLVNPTQDMLNIMTNSAWPIYVTGPYQIVFRLRVPFAWFPGMLVAYEGLIFDTQYVLNHGGFGTPGSPNSQFNQNPIPGTGPYAVTGYSENAYVKFAQNPNYWGANITADELAKQPLFDPGHAKNVVVNYKIDDIARYTDLSKGIAQIATVQAPDWNLVTSNPQTYSYLKLPPWGMAYGYIGLNTHLYPTNITEVRQAIVHAINYTDLYQKAFGGQMSPFLGPEYPAWKDYYDLGNLPPYEYNPTLAKEYLAKANISNMPNLVMRVPAGSTAYIDMAQVIQANLGDIGIPLDIDVLSLAAVDSPFGNYQTQVTDAAQCGNLVTYGSSWAPATLTPLEQWGAIVSSRSNWGNLAGYSNPIVENGINAFTSSTDVASIQSQLKEAQAQVYNDAPYIWIGMYGLWGTSGGSLVWKQSVVTGFMTDPLYSGQTTAPIFNTVTFAA